MRRWIKVNFSAILSFFYLFFIIFNWNFVLQSASTYTILYNYNKTKITSSYDACEHLPKQWAVSSHLSTSTRLSINWILTISGEKKCWSISLINIYRNSRNKKSEQFIENHSRIVRENLIILLKSTSIKI